MALWHGRRAMAKRRQDSAESERRLPPPRAAGDLIGAIGGRVVPPLRLRPERDRQPLGAKSSASATPRCPRPNRSASRPAAQVGRHTDPTGRWRPCAAGPASRPGDHRAGQPLLRLCRGRPAAISPGQAAGRATAHARGPSFARCRRSLARACAKSPTRNFALALKSLAAHIASSSGAPSLPARRHAQARQ